jgi:hypothetical protein
VEQVKIHRTGEFAKREYEGNWSALLNVINKAVEEKEESLSRVLSSLYQSFSPEKDNSNLFILSLNNPIIRFPEKLDTTGIINLVKLITSISVIKEIDKDTERIVELGSGYGDNLCNIWLNNGPKNAEYYALEYTENGRKCSETLASFEPKMNLQTFEFDYHNADFSMLSENKKTAVFTSFSVEQIPILSVEFFNRLLAIPGLDKCIHIEPVGWQLPVEIFGALETDNFGRNLCLHKDYNKNLYRMVTILEKQKKIKVLNIVKDFLGSGPKSGTYISWQKV